MGPCALNRREPGDERQAKSEGLSGTGASLAEHVAARKRVGDGGGLDGERGGDSAPREDIKEGLGESELCERDSGVRLVGGYESTRSRTVAGIARSAETASSVMPAATSVTTYPSSPRVDSNWASMFTP